MLGVTNGNTHHERNFWMRTKGCATFWARVTSPSAFCQSPWVTMPLRNMTTAQCMCAHTLPCKCTPPCHTNWHMSSSGSIQLSANDWLVMVHVRHVGVRLCNTYQNDCWSLKWHWCCKRCQTQTAPSTCNPMQLEQYVGV